MHQKNNGFGQPIWPDQAFKDGYFYCKIRAIWTHVKTTVPAIFIMKTCKYKFFFQVFKPGWWNLASRLHMGLSRSWIYWSRPPWPRRPKEAMPNFDILKITEGVVFHGSSIKLKLLSNLVRGTGWPQIRHPRPLKVTEAEIVIFHRFLILSCDCIFNLKVGQRPRISEAGRAPTWPPRPPDVYS